MQPGVRESNSTLGSKFICCAGLGVQTDTVIVIDGVAELWRPFLSSSSRSTFLVSSTGDGIQLEVRCYPNN